MKIIRSLLAFLFLSGCVFAQNQGLTVQVQNAGTPIITSKKWLAVNCSTGLTCTYTNGVVVMTSSATGFTAGGDLSGTSTSQTVIGVNGAAVPASATVAATNSSRQVIAATLPLTVPSGATGLATAVQGQAFYGNGTNAFNQSGMFNVNAFSTTPVNTARQIGDGVTNNTTTFTSATANFTAGDVGSLFWASSATGNYCHGGTTTTATTIASVTNATTVVLSNACSGSHSSVYAVFGPDATTALKAAATAATALTNGSQPATVYVPAGGYIFQSIPFDQTNSVTECYSVFGDGPQKTVFYPSPSVVTGHQGLFNAQNCGAKFSQNVNMPSIMRGFTIDGGYFPFNVSNPTGMLNLTNNMNVDDVTIQNVAMSSGGSACVYATGGTATLIRNLQVYNCAATTSSVFLDAGGYTLYNYFGSNSSNSNNLWLANISSIGNFVQVIGGVIDESFGSNATVVVTGSGGASTPVKFTNVKIYNTTSGISVDGTSKLECYQCDIGPFETSASNSTGITIASGGVVKFSGGRLAGIGTGKAINNSGTFVDMGGIECVLTAGGATPCGSANWLGTITGSGAYYGTASITGTAQTSGNVALTSGWGVGAAISAVSGNTKVEQFTITAAGTPGASPVLTVTFPQQFWVAPICTITQEGGTFAVLSNPTFSNTATTTAITFTGTPVAAQTYTYTLQCDNP